MRLLDTSRYGLSLINETKGLSLCLIGGDNHGARGTLPRGHAHAALPRLPRADKLPAAAHGTPGPWPWPAQASCLPGRPRHKHPARDGHVLRGGRRRHLAHARPAPTGGPCAHHARTGSPHQDRGTHRDRPRRACRMGQRLRWRAGRHARRSFRRGARDACRPPRARARQPRRRQLPRTDGNPNGAGALRNHNGTGAPRGTDDPQGGAQ